MRSGVLAQGQGLIESESRMHISANFANLANP
jgi:hypothetical protein